MTEQDAEARSRRFAEAATPLLDDAYRLARFMLRNPADAEDAVQECYLRALRHFDSYRGPVLKPWLFSILRNVCHSQFAGRGRRETPSDFTQIENRLFEPLWQEAQITPEADVLRQHEANAIQKIIEALPQPFREVIVLRELDGLSYRDIAAVTGVAQGTVMSRLARGRAMLRTALSDAGHGSQQAKMEDRAVSESERAVFSDEDAAMLAPRGFGLIGER
jgi:RNA polymerase sigma-70 factor (ECF subfamily)